MEKEEEIRQSLEHINQLIAPYALAYISPKKDCVLLKENARSMKRETMELLTDNIKRDGFLSQLPLCIKEGEKYRVISGNHRIKAQIKQELENVLVMYVENIDKNKELYFQLSHNSIVGEDDRVILKNLFEQIDDVKVKQTTGLSDVDFLDIKNVPLPSIGEKDYELTEIKYYFISARAEDIDEVLKELDKNDLGDNARLVVGDYMEYLKVVAKVKEKYDIKSNTVAFNKMIEIVENKLNKLK